MPKKKRKHSKKRRQPFQGIDGGDYSSLRSAFDADAMLTLHSLPRKIERLEAGYKYALNIGTDIRAMSDRLGNVEHLVNPE